MRKIESWVEYMLIAVFVYAAIEMTFGIAGDVTSSPTYFLPFRINGFVAIAGVLISGLCASFFPLWNVGNYLNTMNVQTIMTFTRRYRITYYYIMMGYIGLCCWCASETLFDVAWCFGALFIVLFVWNMFLTPIIFRQPQNAER